MCFNVNRLSLVKQWFKMEYTFFILYYYEVHILNVCLNVIQIKYT